MRAVAVILLFICAVGAMASRKRVHLPKTDLTELNTLLEDTKNVADPATFGGTATLGNLLKGAKYSAKQNDVHKRDESHNPINNLVKPIHMIVPDLKKIKEARDKLSHEYAKEFVEALKTENDDNKVIALFGKHVRLLHERCMKKKLEFGKAVHESELFKNHSDNVDFVQVMDDIIRKAERGEADVFDAFVNAAKEHDLEDHPGVKVVIAIGGLVADAACDQKLDGLLQAIGKLLKEHNKQLQQEDEPYYRKSGMSRTDCTKWKVMYQCIAMPRRISFLPEKSLMRKALRLVFNGGCTFNEACAVKSTLEIIKDIIDLGRKFEDLKRIDNAHEQAMISKFVSYYSQGEHEKADKLLGDHVLRSLRRGMLTGYLLPEYLGYVPEKGCESSGGSASDDGSGSSGGSGSGGGSAESGGGSGDDAHHHEDVADELNKALHVGKSRK